MENQNFKPHFQLLGLEKSRLVGIHCWRCAFGIMTCLKISNHRHLTSHYPAATLFSACCHSRPSIFSHRSHTRLGVFPTLNQDDISSIMTNSSRLWVSDGPQDLHTTHINTVDENPSKSLIFRLKLNH